MRFLIFLLFLTNFLFAGDKMTPEEYIEKYKDDAIKEMKRVGVPASITLAQGMLESGNGNSELAKKAKNHFGIKCHSDWKGATFTMDDDAKDECFRKYKSVWESYRDHSDFLKGKKRYADLFELKITDYKGWAKGLKKAGYATDPKYPKRLITIIERHNLDQYDTKKGRKKKKEEKEKEEGEEENEVVSIDASVDQEKHKVQLSDNFVKYIEVKKGDTYCSIAKEFKVRIDRLYKYNDASEKTILKEGEKIYLQPKRRKGKAKKHVVKPGETYRDISQEHGVKLKHLLKRNGLSTSDEPTPGEVLILKGKK